MVVKLQNFYTVCACRNILRKSTPRGTQLFYYTPFFGSQILEIECWLKVHKLLGKGLLGLWLDQSLLLRGNFQMVVRKLKQYFTKIYSTQLKIGDNAIPFSSIILPHISVFMICFLFFLWTTTTPSGFTFVRIQPF